MNKNRILHIFPNQKFTQPFIDFVNNNFPPSEHLFLVIGAKDFVKIESNNIIILSHISLMKNLFLFLKSLYNAERIIFHSLFFNERTLQIVLFQPWLLKKSYWIMWGGDFYFPETQPRIRKKIIKKIGHCIGNKGDYEFVKDIYSARSKRIFSIMYPSNLYKEISYQQTYTNDCINILVGNSANPSNNHIEVFEKLLNYNRDKIMIYSPLSYGGADEEYTKKVINKGKDLFGDRFKPMEEFIPFNEYIEFLSKIDIALFNPDRQQAFGNIITLLGFGKKVYLKSSVSTFSLLKDYRLDVFDIDDFGLEDLSTAKRVFHNNKKIIKKYFSEDALVKQLTNIFEF